LAGDAAATPIAVKMISPFEDIRMVSLCRVMDPHIVYCLYALLERCRFGEFIAEPESNPVILPVCPGPLTGLPETAHFAGVHTVPH
jgi:hypothetical protein